jgi:hypothetical protein
MTDSKYLTVDQARAICRALTAHIENCGWSQSAVQKYQLHVALETILTGAPADAVRPAARTD